MAHWSHGAHRFDPHTASVASCCSKKHLWRTWTFSLFFCLMPPNLFTSHCIVQNLQQSRPSVQQTSLQMRLSKTVTSSLSSIVLQLFMLSSLCWKDGAQWWPISPNNSRLSKEGAFESPWNCLKSWFCSLRADSIDLSPGSVGSMKVFLFSFW